MSTALEKTFVSWEVSTDRRYSRMEGLLCWVKAMTQLLQHFLLPKEAGQMPAGVGFIASQ